MAKKGCIGFSELVINRDIQKTDDSFSNKRFNFVDVTGDLISGLFDSSKSRRESMSKLESIINSDNIFKNSRRIFDDPSVFEGNILFQKDDSENAGDIARAKAIAMQTILSEFESQQNIYDKLLNQSDASTRKQKHKELSAMVDPDTGLMNIPTLGLYENVGRQFMNSMGLVLTKDSLERTSPENLSKFYRDRGEAIVKMLEDSGVVKIDSLTANQSAMLNNDIFSDSSGEKFRDSTVASGGSSIVRLNLESFDIDTKDHKEIQTLHDAILSKNVSTKDDALKKLPIFKKVSELSYAINNITTPRNLRIHETKIGRHDTTLDAMTLIPQEKNILNGLRNVPMKIQPYYVDMLKDVRQIIQSEDLGNVSYQDAVNNLIKIAGTDKKRTKNIKKVLFFIDNSKILLSSDSKTEISKQLSATSPFSVLLENLDFVIDSADNNGSLYADHAIAKNGRLTNMLTLLNPQGDNKLGRAMYGTDPYALEIFDEKGNETKEFKHLMEDLNENYGITIDTMNNPEVKRLMAIHNGGFDSAGNPNTLLALEFMADAKMPFKSKSIYHALNAIDTMYKIQKAKDEKSNVIKDLTYLSGPDATASGALIMLMQVAGKNPYADEILYKLGIFTKDGKTIDEDIADGNVSKDEALKDAYDILVKQVQRIKDGANDAIKKLPKEDTARMQAEAKAESFKLLDRITSNNGVFKSERDLLKSPIMTFLYGQAEKNNKRELGYAIVDDIYDNQTNEAILKEFEDAGVVIDSKDVQSSESKVKLANYYSDVLGSAVMEQLMKEFNDNLFKDYNSQVEDKISQLKDIVNDPKYTYSHSDAVITKPIVALKMNINSSTSLEEYAEFRKYGAPLTKARQTLSSDGKTLFTKDFLNPATGKVIGQHLMDSSTLELSYEKYFDRIRKENSDFSKIKELKSQLKSAELADKESKTADSKKAVIEAREKWIKERDAWMENIDPSLHIHDQIKGSIPFTIEIEQNYRDSLNELSSAYDFIQMLDMELGYAKTTSTNKTIAERAKVDFEESRVKVDKEVDKKIESLENATKVSRVFGNEANLSTDNFGLDNLNSRVNQDENVQDDSIADSQSDSEADTQVNTEDSVIDDNNSNIPSDESFEQQVVDVDKQFGTAREVVKFAQDSLSEVTGKHRDMVKKIINFARSNSKNKIIKGKNSYGGAIGHAISTDIFNSNAQTEEKIELLAHEISHFETGIYINDNPNDKDVKLLLEVTDKLENFSNHPDVFTTDSEKKALSRINYIVSQTGTDRVQELVAVLESEPDVADIIYKGVGSKSSNIVKRLIAKVKDFINKKVFRREEIEAAISRLKDNQSEYLTEFTEKGIKKKANKLELGAGKNTRPLEQIYKQVLKGKIDTGLLGAVSVGIEIGNQFTVSYSESIFKGFNDLTGADQKLRKANVLIKKEVPVYANALNYVNDIWKDNTFIQQMKTYIGAGNDKFDRMKLNDFLTTALRAIEKRNQNDNDQIVQIEDVMKKEFSEDYKDKKSEKALLKKLNNIFGKSGIFALVANGELKRLAEGEISLNDLITEVEGRTNNNVIKVSKELGNLYINGVDLQNDSTGGFLSSEHAFGYGNENYVNSSTLSALYALRNINGSEEMLVDMYANKKGTFDKLVEASIATSSLTDKLYEDHNEFNVNMQMGNKVKELYDINYEIRPINEEEFRKGKYEENQGWKILRKPKNSDSLGLVYRESSSGFQPGAGINTSFVSTGVRLDILPRGVKEGSSGVFGFTKPKHRNSAYNSLLASNRRDASGAPIKSQSYVIPLTNEEKKILSEVENPAHTLMRSVGQNRELMDTKELRNVMVSDVFTFTIESQEDIDNLADMINDKDVENPWHLDLNLVPYLQLDEQRSRKLRDIEKKYIRAKGISEVGGLRGKISVTRKDLADKVNGYDQNVFKDYKLNKATEILKKVVSWTKIQQIILNPAKIGADFTSGISLLMTLGLGPEEIYSSFKGSISGVNELGELRNKMVGLEFLVQASSDEGQKAKYQSELDEVVKSIRDHDMAPALFNGMIQSISTDITLKNYDTISGLDKDIKAIITKFARNRNSEELNAVGKAIMGAAKAGVNLEDVVRKIGELSATGDTNLGKAIEKSFVQFADSVSRAKDKNDVERYVSEFIGAPGSELVKLGSAMTQWSDVLPRIALYQHMKKKGSTEEEAVQASLDNFIDYKMNMPKEIKFLSDTFFLMYPSFWIKIQKVIFNLGKNHPISLGAALLGTELMGTSGLHILDSNIFAKIEKGTVVDSPGFDDLTFFLG